ncbi:restriction endonuclease subunit S [Methylococcus sp. ANG]|uniref:restriction endonuclease subunit S n=1 Tax=Methylococcus sp. ANG TaxID=3231903 RepID=UPI0034592FCB
MHQFPRHTQYKDSGLAWVGEIPAHWQTRRNRFLFREVDRRSTHGKETHLSMSQVHGLVPSNDLGRKSLQSENYAGGKLVEEHDLVLNRLKAHLGVFARAKQAGVVSPDYTVLRPKGGVSVRYCESLFKTPMYVGEFRRRTKGIVEGFWRLYTDDFYNVSALLPPPEEQDQIVAYLRGQDAHIARFIKAKRDLIALLAEQKQTVIEGAVTKGLDAAAAKRDSGIDWIPLIPAHWETCKLKHIAVFNPSRSESAALRLSDEAVSFLPMECITTDGKLQNVETRRTTEVWEGYTYFRRNDVVMAKITPCFENGKGGLLDALPTEIGFGTTEFIVLRAAARRVRPAFLAKLLSIKTFRILGAEAMTGAAGQQRVPLDFVKNFRVALPPLDEQDQILSTLQTATAEQDAAIERIRSEIALIREYRDRLITDVVTGQVDVRGWQPGPDDVASDEELTALGDDEADTADEEEADGDE